MLSLCCPRAAGSPVVSGPGLAGSLSSLGPARSARLAPRQSLPANVVACPTFRFSSTPYIPALTSSCSGSGSKVLLRSGIALAAAPATALSCSVMTGRFDLTDTDGTSWLGGSSLEQTSAEYAAVDQMFLLAGSAGTTLSADPAKCGDTFAELAFARNEVAGRLLRLELKCNNGAYIGYLYFKWYPTGFTPVPANLSTFACGAAGSTYFDWTTGSAYTPAAPSRTTAGLALTAWPATSSTTGKISSTTLAPAPSPALAGDLVPAAATTTTTTQTVLLKTSTLTAKPTTTAALFGDNKNLSLSCPTFPAGTNPPGPGNLLDAFDKGVFNYLVSSKNVPGRTMLIYLGDDPSIAACRGVLQSPANASDCEIRYRLKGSWRQLRGCTWKSDPEDKGYIPMVCLA